MDKRVDPNAVTHGTGDKIGEIKGELLFFKS